MYRLYTLFFLLLTVLELVSGLKRNGPRTPLPAENWAAAAEKAKAFISQLDVTEKASMVTGSPGACIGNISPIPRLNFSGICFTDGPQAVSRMDLISVFPAALTMAATWDKELLYERGYALGEEFRGKGSHVGLGPCAGPLGRHPLGGRNWEGFSPDPYLSGVAMRETIFGTQDAGTQTTSKHIIGNEQETQRSNTFLEDGTEIHALSSNIDDRTMHELYMWPFADAVKAGTTSVMCAFNRVNQTYSCEDDQLLNHILKEELGFEGYVFSDWFATHSGAKSINAGLDLTMPGYLNFQEPEKSYFGANITTNLENGSITMSRLDDMIQRIMTPYYLLNQDHNDYPSLDPSAICILGASLYGEISCSIPARDVRGNHSSLIRRMGSDGTVLLKNVNNALPLKSPKSIAVYGNDAGDLINGLTYPLLTPREGFDQGTLGIGGGSGSARYASIVDPLSAIKAKARSIGARVQYVLNNTILAAEDDFQSIYPQPDVCLVFLKTYTSEGYDRVSWVPDYNSTAVVTNVAKRCNNTIVVTHSGGINTMSWSDHPNITGILAAHFPGEESGNSLVDILWGDVNPSAKLPYTIPAKESDYDIPIVYIPESNRDPNAWQADFTEGLMIDYRHFDKYNITPLYPFGFGLSYTTFDLTPLQISPASSSQISPTPDPSSKIAPGGNPDLYTTILTATTTLSNTGSVTGAQVVQLYLSFPQDTSPHNTPKRVLRGFEKVELGSGETKDVVFELTRRDLSYWEVEKSQWRIPEGEFEIQAGFDVSDTRILGKVAVL